MEAEWENLPIQQIQDLRKALMKLLAFLARQPTHIV